MKRYSIILIFCFLASCNKKQIPPIHETQVSLIYDIANTHEHPELAEPILSLFDFQNDMGSGANFRLTLLCGTLLNPTQQIHVDGLPNDGYTNSDEVEQYKQLTTSFNAAVKNSITTFPKGQTMSISQKQRCEFFATCASELELLAASNASRRILIISGNLTEINPDFSSISVKGKKLLKTHPDKVAQLLQEHRKLPTNLVGISAYFIMPIRQDHSEQYAALIGIYQELLRNRGARVIISDKKYFQL